MLLNQDQSHVDRREFFERGFVSPSALSDKSKIAPVLSEFASRNSYIKNPHVTSENIRNLLKDPGLQREVKRYCGDSLEVWRSAFFIKANGSAEIAWHHDKHFYDAESDTINIGDLNSHFSALIALTDMTGQQGVLEVLPGSHLPTSAYARDTRPYHRRDLKDHFLNDIPETIIEAREQVPIPAGSFLIFHSAVIHRSLEHTGHSRRVGLALRLKRSSLTTPPEMAAPKEILNFSIG